jgi:hypothetical protein
MPKAMFKQLGYPALSPTTLTDQLVDSSIRYTEGAVESLLVKVKNVFADFVVLDMEDDGVMPLILRRPFLSDVRGKINVGSGVIRFRIRSKNLMFECQEKEERCYLVHDSVEQLGGKDGSFTPAKETFILIKAKENPERVAKG